MAVTPAFPKMRTQYRFFLIASSLAAVTILSVVHAFRLFPFFRFLPPNFATIATHPASQRASESVSQLDNNPIYARFTPAQIESWDQYYLRTQFRRLLPQDLPSSPPTAPNDVCLMIGRDHNTWHLWRRRNSRSLCVTSPICISTAASKTVMHTSDFQQTECRVVTPDYMPLPAPFDNPHRHEPDLWPCPEIQHRLQLCPLPNTSKALPKPCISPQRAEPSVFESTMKQAESSNSVLKGITVVVPRYPYSANIYHFAALIAHVAHAVSNVHTVLAHYGFHKLNPQNASRTLPLNVLFLNQRRSNLPWQVSLETILANGRMSRIFPKGLRVSYIAETSASHVCVENPVLLGQRGHVNAWPFPNSSEIVCDGTQVPKDAIEFRQDVYSALDIQPPAMFHDSDGNVHLNPPPLVLGYARRAGRTSTVGMGVHAAGTARRFSDEDEIWFSEMLQNETKASGIEFREFLTTPDETFAEQVKKLEQIGFVVGIHGANLANCIFMRPMGALLEIFPANVYSPCYIAGSNSGLAYFVHEANVEASPEESGCSKDEKRCWKLTRQRLVKIGTKKDRDVIRNYVRSGINHLLRIHKKYGNGVPVKYNPLSANYEINGTIEL